MAFRIGDARTGIGRVIQADDVRSVPPARPAQQPRHGVDVSWVTWTVKRTRVFLGIQIFSSVRRRYAFAIFSSVRKASANRAGSSCGGLWPTPGNVQISK